jgi:hypothetical protein
VKSIHLLQLTSLISFLVAHVPQRSSLLIVQFLFTPKRASHEDRGVIKSQRASLRFSIISRSFNLFCPLMKSRGSRGKKQKLNEKLVQCHQLAFRGYFQVVNLRVARFAMPTFPKRKITSSEILQWIVGGSGGTASSWRSLARDETPILISKPINHTFQPRTKYFAANYFALNSTTDHSDTREISRLSGRC